MDILGIECEVISSDQRNHDWNRVKLNGEWYMVDVTWDDDYEDNEGYETYRISYTFFNMPSKFFGHKASDYTETAEGTKYMGIADKNL